MSIYASKNEDGEIVIDSEEVKKLSAELKRASKETEEHKSCHEISLLDKKTFNELLKIIVKYNPENNKRLTGKELKFAAENKIPVRYVERFYNPLDSNIDEICIMKKIKETNDCYFISHSDIKISRWKNNEEVKEDFMEGEMVVLAVNGQTYK